MENKEIECVTVYVDGRVVRTNTEKETIFRDLTSDLISKKINHCSYIKSIKRNQLYNGFIDIIVFYDNGVKRIYHIKER